MSMDWQPTGPDPRTAIPAGTPVTVQGWCGCGRYLGKRSARVPAEVGFIADHGQCPGPAQFVVQWTAPAERWTPQHP